MSLRAKLFFVAVCFISMHGLNSSLAQAQTVAVTPRILELTPDIISERRKTKRGVILDGLKSLSSAAVIHPYMVIFEKAKWRPGRTLTVAFLGGSSELHANIERVASEWSQYANIKFDFGRNPASGQYRMWSTSDTQYKSDIRISFNQKGYWSVVGSESRDNAIVGPHEASMNYEKFDKGMPAYWEGTVRHEFGHAIGLEHEHQSPQQPCDWRWTDDTGYVPTKDTYGQFIADSAGRYPSLYRVLGGPPNKWDKPKVDQNFRQLPNSSAYRFGAFDNRSIMKYHYDAWMFRGGTNSACYSQDDNETFSDEDKLRVAEYYPMNPALADAERDRRLGEISRAAPDVAASPILKKQLGRIETELTRY